MTNKNINLISKYKVWAGAFIALIVISLVLSILKPDNTKQVINQIKESRPLTSNSGSSIDLAMVGDMLPHETVTKAAATESGYDYLNLISSDLQKSFQKADLHFCNQEAVSAADISVKGYPAFNAPVAFPKDINKFGCDIISTANNHAADQGLAGIEGTLDVWDGIKPLAISGMHRTKDEAQRLQIAEKNGLKIGFTAFNEVNNISPPVSDTGVNMLSNINLLEEQINGLKEKSDIVVVSVHWGDEDSHNLTSAQREYARKIADLGADIIIGTGPHVWQPYQVLDRPDGGKTYLWNSIGNGLNSQTKKDQLFSAVALIKISKDKEGRVSVSNPRVLPTYMHFVWGSGVGLSQSQLLARKELKWTVLNGSQNLIDERNDFKTTEEGQLNNLRKYLNNDQVEFLESY